MAESIADRPPHELQSGTGEAVEPPRKRRRRDPSPPRAQSQPDQIDQTSSAPVPSPPASFRPIYHPSHYVPQGAPPTAFQLPTHLTAFSYSPTRELLLGRRKDEAIAVYAHPPLGVDLNQGFEDCVWRKADEEGGDEGLDALLETVLDWESNESTGMASDVLRRANVISWRGMLTKLLLAVYEAEGATRGRADGWEMNAMVIDGTLYLEESNSPSKIAAKAASESSYKLQSYYGYSFESYCTTPPSTPQSFSVPNTNVQWCSVVKTNLGGFRLLVGGEVDCVRPEANLRNVRTDDFMELKTNIVIQNGRDETNFERQKLLKHYAQSFLLGVPQIVVGFRTRPGQLTAIQSFKTLEIPRLVRGKPHAWDPLACLASAKDLLSFVTATVANSPSTRSAQSRLSLGSEDPEEGAGENGENWPIFRVSFVPGGRDAGVSIREVRQEEVERDVLGAKKKEDRVGFLLKRWVDGVVRRRSVVVPSTTTSAGAILIRR